ncbi:unnamed protein product [Rotaria socialis]|uniref:C2 domain-containing protein n=1 Tax=Rotaria socialis TaxID=392032 RepID=A0A818LAK3_9BILA|nr:unnamed protein product [Rotaria socialis]
MHTYYHPTHTPLSNRSRSTRSRSLVHSSDSDTALRVSFDMPSYDLDDSDNESHDDDNLGAERIHLLIYVRTARVRIDQLRLNMLNNDRESPSHSSFGRTNKSKRATEGFMANESTSELNDGFVVQIYISISEARNILQISTNNNLVRNSYFVCRAFWNEELITSIVCWGSSSPKFNFEQKIPILLTKSTLEKMHNNIIVIEVWDKKISGPVDKIIGIVKISLEQFYTSFKDKGGRSDFDTSNDHALRTITNNIFSVILHIEQAAHLPNVYSKQDNARVPPNPYVTYSAADSHYLCQKSGDKVLGFVSIDLSLLLSGLQKISGWYNIVDTIGNIQGQLKIDILPQEDLSELKCFKYKSNENQTNMNSYRSTSAISGNTSSAIMTDLSARTDTPFIDTTRSTTTTIQTDLLEHFPESLSGRPLMSNGLNVTDVLSLHNDQVRLAQELMTKANHLLETSKDFFNKTPIPPPPSTSLSTIVEQQSTPSPPSALPNFNMTNEFRITAGSPQITVKKAERRVRVRVIY